MCDNYGYVAFGDDELFHHGALFSALRLLFFCPDAKIIVVTDRPRIFEKYPLEIVPLTSAQAAEMAFGNRYRFGIKAAGLIEMLKRSDRLFYMDTDIYPTGNISRCFNDISASQSIMRYSEGTADFPYRVIEDKGFLLGNYRISGYEPMWNSGVLGVHRSNLPALVDAYSAIEQMIGVVSVHTPEQFCIGIALSRGERKINPHRLPLGDYNSSGKKAFARKRVAGFVRDNSHLSVDRQIANAANYRLWRTPLDLWKQKVIERS